MIRAGLLALCLLLAGGAAAQEADEEDGPLPFLETRDGMRWSVSIERSTEERRSGVPPRTWSLKARYDAVLARTMDRGNVVTWTPVEVKVEGQPAPESSAVASGAPIFFRADGSLAPTRIENWDALRATLAKSAPNLGQATAEAAARFLLPDAALIALPQDMPVSADKPLELDDQVANPLGGPPIASRMRFEPATVSGDRVILRWTRSIDPSAGRALADALRNAAEKGGADAATKAKLAGLTVERRDECRFEMDARNGMTRLADCTITTGITSASEQGGRVERVRIVQTPRP